MTTVLGLYAQTLGDLTTTLDPVPDADLARTLAGSDGRGGILTHPAWTLSHLCGSAALICQLLDADVTDPTSALFTAHGPGSQPSAHRADYMPKATLIMTLQDLHAQATAAVHSADHDLLTRAPPPPFAAFAPTISDIVIYLLAAHESYHLSCMISWHRRWSQGHVHGHADPRLS